MFFEPWEAPFLTTMHYVDGFIQGKVPPLVQKLRTRTRTKNCTIMQSTLDSFMLLPDQKQPRDSNMEQYAPIIHLCIIQS
jgi:hypothetical protein